MSFSRRFCSVSPGWLGSRKVEIVKTRTPLERNRVFYNRMSLNLFCDFFVFFYAPKGPKVGPSRAPGGPKRGPGMPKDAQRGAKAPLERPKGTKRLPPHTHTHTPTHTHPHTHPHTHRHPHTRTPTPPPTHPHTPTHTHHTHPQKGHPPTTTVWWKVVWPWGH